MVIFTVPVEHLHVCVGSKNLSGWQLFFGVPDDVREATALDRPPEASNASCLLHQLNSDPNIFMVPLGGCGGGQYVRRQSALGIYHEAFCEYLFQNVDQRVFIMMEHTSLLLPVVPSRSQFVF